MGMDGQAAPEAWKYWRQINVMPCQHRHAEYSAEKCHWRHYVWSVKICSQRQQNTNIYIYNLSNILYRGYLGCKPY